MKETNFNFYIKCIRLYTMSRGPQVQGEAFRFIVEYGNDSQGSMALDPFHSRLQF
jgi:hypothetical protein